MKSKIWTSFKCTICKLICVFVYLFCTHIYIYSIIRIHIKYNHIYSSDMGCYQKMKYRNLVLEIEIEIVNYLSSCYLVCARVANGSVPPTSVQRDTRLVLSGVKLLYYIVSLLLLEFNLCLSRNLFLSLLSHINININILCLLFST